MNKNESGKWVVFAFGLPDHANPNEPITGDAANITANIRIDGGAANAVDDVNPTELEDGFYIFDITAVESNGDNLLLTPQSSTANVQVIATPAALWTTPASFNSGALALASTALSTANWTNTRAGYMDELAAANLPADLDTLLTRIIGTLATGTHNPATAAQIAVLSDWINGGRLDLILDIIAADVINIDGAAMRGTDGANTTAPDNTSIAAILVDTNDLQTNQGNWLTATGFSTHSVADIFNEVLSKASYNVGQSLAKIVRELGSWNSAEGVVTGTPTTTVIATNITGYDTDFFRDQGFWAYNGATQAGQSRIVSAYNTDGTFTFDEPFTTALISGDDVVIATPHIHSITEISEAVRSEMDDNSTQLNTTLPALIGALNDPTAAAVAAAVASYDMGNGRTIEEALAFLRNKWTIIGGTLTVYDTDDTTILWTSTMTQTAGDPVSASDPA